MGSCRHEAPESAKIALELGADANETDLGRRWCLQLAVSAPLVNMVLDAGVSIEAANRRRQRFSGMMR